MRCVFIYTTAPELEVAATMAKTAITTINKVKRLSLPSVAHTRLLLGILRCASHAVAGDGRQQHKQPLRELIKWWR